MRIALISFEFPPAVAVGGIGTYAAEAARMLAAAGCEIEVFAAGRGGHEPAERPGVRIIRLDVTDREGLREALVPIFAARHRASPFDVLESPEIGAEGAAVAEAFPEVARVVKLHTPTFLVQESAYEAPTWWEQARFSLGALRRGHFCRLGPPGYLAETDPECRFAQGAHEIAAPCQAIASRVCQAWALDPARVSVFPYPFSPGLELLALPPTGQARTIGFLARLEPRKGIVELALAIPAILQRAPWVRFRLMGPSWPYKQSDMAAWIRSTCRDNLEAITFTGTVPRECMAEELERCDFMVLPSRWENYPMACIEAMAAGRPVIGSEAGGMAELIAHGENGLLITPRSPKAIAAAVLSLIDRPHEVTRFANAGRKRVLEWLSPERIAPLQMASYQRAIERCRAN